MKAFAVACAALVVGLVGGASFDRATERPPVTRGGYRVLDVDLHVHTRFSDGLLSPIDVVTAARRHGLDAFAVTEHNQLLPAKIARAWSRLVGGPTVLLGEEVTRGSAHLIAIGLHEPVSSREGVSAALDAIHAQGAIAIAAHPVAHFWPALVPHLDRIDGSEVMHPLARVPLAAGAPAGARWRWSSALDFYARGRAAKPTFAAIGSSDHHGFATIGAHRTWVFAERPDADAILDALKKGRTVVKGTDGVLRGDAAMIALVEREPIPEAPAVAPYRARGPIDAVTRIVGWLGAIGVVILRPRRRTDGRLPRRARSEPPDARRAA